jgi:UDP:flavonoid glycosyltransferase YjiC (YdhE family)
VERAGYPLRVGADPPEAELRPVWQRVAALSSDEGAILVVGEIFAGLNVTAMLPTVEAACDAWRPDLVVREPNEYASALAADARGIPHARVAISLSEMEDAGLAIAGPVLDARRRGIAERLRASPYLTTFPPSVDETRFPGTVRVHDPAADLPVAPLPDWWGGGDDRPLVYVTFGSVAGSFPMAAAAFRRALDAVETLDVRVLVTVGRVLDPDALGALPPNVHVEPWVPQRDVLGHAAAVVFHGGSGTMIGALAAGCPMVVVPLFADQPYNARRLAAVRAGVAVDSDRKARDHAIRPLGEHVTGKLRAAVETVLAEPSYREAAGRVAAEMRSLPAVDTALGTLDPSATVAG